MNKKRRGRGEGSIEELPSGKWRATLSAGSKFDSGKRDRRHFTADTKREALGWLRAAQAEQLKGVLADPGNQTVVDWLKHWLEIKKPKVEPRSWEPHEQHVRLHLTPALRSVPLAKLRPMHVENVFAKLTANSVSPAMQRKIGTTLRMALKDATRLQLLAFNPAAVVAQPKATKPEIAIWTASEVQKFLLATKGERLEALYVLALDAGMRQGELFGLHWPQIDFDAGAILVIQSSQETGRGFRLKAPKSKAGRRRIAVAPETLSALAGHRDRMVVEERDVESGPVFVDTEGGFLRRNNLHRNSFGRLIRTAGVRRIGFHGIRHTAATLLLLNGINIKAVSVRLGHSSTKVTLDSYSHFLPEMDGQTVAVVRKLLFNHVSPTVVPQPGT